MLAAIVKAYIYEPIVALLKDSDYWNETVQLALADQAQEKRIVDQMRKVLHETGKSNAARADEQPSYAKYVETLKTTKSPTDLIRMRGELHQELSRKMASLGELTVSMAAGQEID